jgi:hypothetical protein
MELKTASAEVFKADALGRFAIRVINPGDIRSKATTVRYSEIAANRNE